MQHQKIVSIHQRRILEDGKFEKGIFRRSLKTKEDVKRVSNVSIKLGTNRSSDKNSLFVPGTEASSHLRSTGGIASDNKVSLLDKNSGFL